jgi:hypothetical protein
MSPLHADTGKVCSFKLKIGSPVSDRGRLEFPELRHRRTTRHALGAPHRRDGPDHAGARDQQRPPADVKGGVEDTRNVLGRRRPHRQSAPHARHRRQNTALSAFP